MAGVREGRGGRARKGWRLSGGVLTVSQRSCSLPRECRGSPADAALEVESKNSESEEAGPTALGG